MTLFLAAESQSVHISDSTEVEEAQVTFHSSGEWRFFQSLKALDLGIILHGQTLLRLLTHLSYCLKRVFWFFGPSGLSS